MLVLQYNWMVLERAQDDLHAADHFVGHVHFLIQKSSQTTAFKYAMQEGHSSLSSGRLSNWSMFIPEQTLSHSLIDVDLT